MNEQISLEPSMIFNITPPNVTLRCKNAEIVFDKKQIDVKDILEVYLELKTFLNSFQNVYV